MIKKNNNELLTNKEISDIINKLVKKNGYTSLKDMEQIVRYFKDNHSEQCYMATVVKMIKEKFKND